MTFEVSPQEAQTVEVCCDLNGWEPVTMKRTKEGPFRARMRFPKNSVHEFRYRINGDAWINDEAADAYSLNEFGTKNGVVEIAAGA